MPERLSESDRVHLEAAMTLLSDERVGLSDEREEKDVPALRFIGLYRDRRAAS